MGSPVDGLNSPPRGFSLDPEPVTIDGTVGSQIQKNCGGQVTEQIDFQAMPLDELWSLREEISSMLAAKVEAEKRELEQRLNTLKRARRLLKRGVVVAGLTNGLSSSPISTSPTMS
jgi:hypothetical protein